MTGRRRSIAQSGFALLIVLWTMGFLALLGTRIVLAGRSDTQLADNLKQEAVLEAAANGAVANVMFSLQAARDARIQPDGITREIRIGQTPVLVRVEKESDRINLNRASPALLRALITEVGGTPAVAPQLAAAIVDWHSDGTDTGQDAAQAPRYRAASLAYGPPGTRFQSVGELADVLGMTPGLFERLAPHLTVLTKDDPDVNTRDPVVARALTDTAGVADASVGSQQASDDDVLRIVTTAVGTGNARYASVVVASADFQETAPRINILLHERVNRDAAQDVVASGF
jgi:general secretion pathway protein K